MAGLSSTEMFKVLLEQIKDNSDKLQEIQKDYYSLKAMFEHHHTVDEKLHQEVKEFIESASKRLDQYNHQLELHISGTIQNRDEINAFKNTIQPLLEQYIEEQALKKANNKVIKKWTTYLGIATALIGVVSGILKLMNVF